MIFNEMSNSSKFNLDKEFDKYNKLVFNNEIVKNFPIVWSHGRTKNRFGMVSFVPATWEIKKFEIINGMILTYEEFVDTLVHEMIHVFLIQKRVRDRDSHGPHFLKLMRDINSKHGLHISVYGSRENMTVDPDKKVKPYYILKLELDGKPFISPFGTLEGYDHNRMIRWGMGIDNVTLYETTNAYFTKFKKKRNFKSSISDSFSPNFDHSELDKDTKILYRYSRMDKKGNWKKEDFT